MTLGFFNGFLLIPDLTTRVLEREIRRISYVGYVYQKYQKTKVTECRQTQKALIIKQSVPSADCHHNSTKKSNQLILTFEHEPTFGFPDS